MRAERSRRRPSLVLGPVLLPPWQRHRPLIMAGARHGSPARLRAPQRGAAFGLPRGLPFHYIGSPFNALGAIIRLTATHNEWAHARSKWDRSVGACGGPAY